MFWLKYIQNLVKAFHGDESPNQLAAGFALGAIMGFVPKIGLMALVLWAVVIFFRVHIGMAIAATLIFAMLGVITDPLAEKLGFAVLTNGSLQGFWTTLYNTPIVPFTSFNNTLVMGNLLVGLILFLPIFFAFKRVVLVYRERYRERVMKWKVMQAFKASAIYDLYSRWINR